MTANVLILSAAGMLVSAYLMVGQKALFTTIRLYAINSLLLALVAGTMAISDSRPEPFLNVPTSLLICLGLTVIGYRVSTGFEVGTQRVTHQVIGVALSLLLIGL